MLLLPPSAPRPRKQEPRRPTTRWSGPHEQALARHLSPTVWHAVQFALLTGLRRTELARLTWNEVQGCNLTLQSRPRCVARTIPLHSRALQMLNALKPAAEGRSRVFAALGPARQLPALLDQALRHACQMGELPPLRWCHLRAAYRQRLTETGYPPDLIGLLAGQRPSPSRSRA